MSWWRRLLGVDEPEPAPAPEPELRPLPAPLPAASESAGLRKLRGLGRGEPLDEPAALAALAALAGTSQEKDALEALRRAARSVALPDRLAVAAAELFFQRGEHDEALGLLGRTATPGGLMLRAEIEAARGDLASACASLERLLARDIATPGARERLARWRARLGLPLPGAEPMARDATLFTAAQPATPFRIVGEAGRGGAAVVYEAIDEALGRTVALKVYHRPAEAREQIGREGRLAVEIAGPGVVGIHDVDLEAGWLALEWAASATLREMLRQRPGELLALDRWLPPLLSALARLHRLGWAHGDIKPGNVLFRPDGRPLLTDFGLARRAGEPWTGGTPGYLSPRRLQGAPAALSDDVYA
ncbi:MAG: serine/threonine protein kinase, partial [Myxococcales bacterium]